MSTRTFSLLAGAALLAGCGSSDGGSAQKRGPLPASGTGLACARGADAPLSPDCTVERTPTQDGVILTVRHPDGGFRRLRLTKDGRGVVAADGAEQAKVLITGPHEIEVRLGGDRYRLPATLGPVPVQAP